MEDFYETRIDGVDGEIVGLFGVFDGEILFCFTPRCLNAFLFIIYISNTYRILCLSFFPKVM